MNIVDEHRARYGDEIAPVAIALGLIAHDPRRPTRAGYSRENAVHSVIDAYVMSDGPCPGYDELLARLNGLLGADRKHDDLAAQSELDTLRAGHPADQEMRTCGCGATKPGECCAAVEGYFTSLGQRSDDQLRNLVDEGCEAATVLLERRQAVQA